MILSDSKILKNKNALKLLELIKNNSEISRADLAKKTELTPASITKIVQKLINEEIVVELGLGDSTGGRPPKILKLNSKAGNFISIYLASDYIELVLYDLGVKRIYEDKHDIWIRTKNKIIDDIVAMIERAIETSRVKVLGIGIAVNGLVDTKSGISVYSPHYKWNNVNLVKILEEKFNIKVYVENDVRAMAMGEKSYGIAKKSENFVVINIENGVGSALYLNNQIYRGTHFGAGEFGHIPIEDNEQRCSCGKKGCLETLVNNQNLEDKYFNLTEKNLKAWEIYEEYNKGNKIAVQLVENIAVVLAKGLVPLVNILNPDLIIIVGDINRAQDKLYKIIIKELKNRTFGNLSDSLNIVSSSFGKESANKGAVSFLMENILK
ncbi:MAG: ROK family transcriptional regulator [Fusobacteriaceae bacterium]|nr:ROK family transcriptional regulator [Fusobacteriaceae bacterium]MBP6466464.1 ROK family transcriptional regulator [Fusobacteriaceae bacterium]MBP9596413.1 ROK family transcriptional regulator [Fusobacteriaceae bacterium]MBU9918067.1 ROK family transcriptional regulator [Fusobacteriaceae bacterium]